MGSGGGEKQNGAAARAQAECQPKHSKMVVRLHAPAEHRISTSPHRVDDALLRQCFDGAYVVKLTASCGTNLHDRATPELKFEPPRSLLEQ